MPYNSLQGLSTLLPKQKELRERSQSCFNACQSKMDFTAELQNPSVPPATVPVHEAMGGHGFTPQPAREIRSEVDKPPASIASASVDVLCFDSYTVDILTSNIRCPALTNIAGSNAFREFMAML